MRRRIQRGAGLGLLAACVFWVVFWSPLFRVRSVDVSGATPELAHTLTQDLQSRLMQRRWLLVPASHAWVYPRRSWTRKLLRTYPLNAVELSVRDHVLFAVVDEKVLTFYYVLDDVMYALDREGTVLRPLDDLERARVVSSTQGGGRTLPVIYDRRGGEGQVAQAPVSSEHLQALVDWHDLLTARTLFTIESIYLGQGGRVDFQTDAGVLIYATLEGDRNEQVQKLVALLDQQVDVSTLEYIDIRFTHRVFYHSL